MYASLVVLVACIAGAVVLAGVVLLLVMLGRRDTKRQPDPWPQDGSGQPPPPRDTAPYGQPGETIPSDQPGGAAPYGQQPPPER